MDYETLTSLGAQIAGGRIILNRKGIGTCGSDGPELTREGAEVVRKALDTAVVAPPPVEAVEKPKASKSTAKRLKVQADIEAQDELVSNLDDILGANE